MKYCLAPAPVSGADLAEFAWSRPRRAVHFAGQLEPDGGDDDEDDAAITSAIMERGDGAGLSIKRPGDDVGDTDKRRTNAMRMEELWVRAHVPKAVEPNLVQARRLIEAMGDEASRYGRKGGLFLPCPFSREQLVTGLGGRNRHLMNLVKTIEVVIPLVPTWAIEMVDVTASFVNRWLCTRAKLESAGLNIYPEHEGVGPAITALPNATKKYGFMAYNFTRGKDGEEPSPHSLGNCLFMNFDPEAASSSPSSSPSPSAASSASPSPPSSSASAPAAAAAATAAVPDAAPGRVRSATQALRRLGVARRLQGWLLRLRL